MRSNKAFSLGKLLLLTSAAAALLSADTVILHNGQRATGTYLGGSAGQVKLLLKGSRVVVYDVKDVELIQFGNGDSTPSSGTTSDGATVQPSVQPPSQTVPVLGANTPITVRLIDPVNSDLDQNGHSYRASVDQPVSLNGRIVISQYSNAVVTLVQRETAGRLEGQNSLALALTSIEAGGKSHNVTSVDLVQAAAPKGARSARTIAGGTALGTIIGAIAGGGKGAAIGAGSGAAAGAVFSTLTPGQKVKLPPETQLIFRLATPLSL